MDPFHKKVLANKTSEIMKRISNPLVLSAHLKTIFSFGDFEEIEAKTSQRGATTGTQTLLSLLAKRGPKAFTLFIHALRDPDISCADLADDLEQEERKLRGEAGKFFIVWKITAVIANEQPREDARLRGGSLIELCRIVPGAEKISNRCNIE